MHDSGYRIAAIGGAGIVIIDVDNFAAAEPITARIGFGASAVVVAGRVVRKVDAAFRRVASVVRAEVIIDA